MSKLTYDVVIVGSGIAGMTAAIYLKRNNLKVLLVEENTPGGQLNRTSTVENYPGYTKIEGSTLALNIYNQITNLNIAFKFSKATSINPQENKIIINNEPIKYNYLIIATGRRPQNLGLENESFLLGRGLSYCATCDGNLYQNREVAVVGGGNTALEEALYLSHICQKVTLIHRRATFRAEKELVEQVITAKNIEIIYQAEVTKYNLKDNELVSITLSNDQEICLAAVFLAIGSTPNSEFVDVAKENNYILVDNEYKTSIDNIYAIGDVIKKTIYQLTTATADATIAASSIIKKINSIKK